MNETEVKKMLTAAQAYIVHLEAVQSEFSDKIGELVEANKRLQDANAILKTGNEGFTNTLKYYAALVGKLEQNVDSLKKTINEMNGVSKWTEVEV
jgi:septal ring factor EnvC (AmiA/AmiB activator)